MGHRCPSPDAHVPANHGYPGPSLLSTHPPTHPLTHLPTLLQVNDVNNIGLLETALGAINGELSVIGVDLTQLTETRQLICAEYGYGGGVDGGGSSPAKTASEVGQYSYYGIFGPYKRWVAGRVQAECRQSAGRVQAECRRTSLCSGQLPAWRAWHSVLVGKQRAGSVTSCAHHAQHHSASMTSQAGSPQGSAGSKRCARLPCTYCCTAPPQPCWH